MDKNTKPLLCLLVICVVISSIVSTKNVFADKRDCSSKKAVSVVVVEPQPNSSKLTLVKIDGAIQKTGLDILNNLAKSCSEHVAILVRDDLKVGTLTQFISMAQKVGYSSEEISFFIFNKNRERMLDFKHLIDLKYSENPKDIEMLIKKGRASID